MILPIIAVIIIFIVGLVALYYQSILVDVIGHFIQQRPDDSEGWLYYGSLLDRAGYHLEALDAIKRAVTISPNYSAAWKKMGDVLTILGDIDRASEAYRFSNS
jgi:tetratricopeptide (TPR) repeat protein